MNKFLALIFVIAAGIAVVATAYMLSKSKLGGKVKASSEKISVIGILSKTEPCVNENLCYQLVSISDGQTYFINTKEFSWISTSINPNKFLGKQVEVTGLYIQGKSSYIVPTEIK